MNVNSYDDISVKSGTSLLPKIRNKPRSFTINSSFPSLSIDTSFSRLKKRKPSKIDLELLYKANESNGNDYYQNDDDPTLYSLYARNILLEGIYNVLNENSADNNVNYAVEFSKLIDMTWFRYFINKKLSPITVILVLRILTKLLQSQNYQYKLAFRNTYKMYKLFNYNIPKYYNVNQIYHILLALTFETPINSIPLNSTFDISTLKKLYKNSIQNNNNNTIYNADSLVTLLKMIKEIIKLNIENINKNYDKINFEQLNNINENSQSKQETNLSINKSPVNSHSPIQNKLYQNIQDKHENNSDNLSINISKQSSGSYLFSHMPFTPSTPRTPRTPRTPLVNLSNTNKKKCDILNLSENESLLYIYQSNLKIFYLI